MAPIDETVKARKPTKTKKAHDHDWGIEAISSVWHIGDVVVSGFPLLKSFAAPLFRNAGFPPRQRYWATLLPEGRGDLRSVRGALKDAPDQPDNIPD
jgi:hypothetical protein